MSSASGNPSLLRLTFPARQESWPGSAPGHWGCTELGKLLLKKKAKKAQKSCFLKDLAQPSPAELICFLSSIFPGVPTLSHPSQGGNSSWAPAGLCSSPAAPEPCQGHSWCQPRAGCSKKLCQGLKASSESSSNSPCGAAELARHRAGALPGKSKPHHALNVVPTPRKGPKKPQSSRAAAVLCRTPQELSGLKDLHLQKPFLIASKTCFKGPESPEISHKKANPQGQRSQNEAAPSRAPVLSCGAILELLPIPGKINLPDQPSGTSPGPGAGPELGTLQGLLRKTEMRFLGTAVATKPDAALQGVPRKQSPCRKAPQPNLPCCNQTQMLRMGLGTNCSIPRS